MLPPLPGAEPGVTGRLFFPAGDEGADPSALAELFLFLPFVTFFGATPPLTDRRPATPADRMLSWLGMAKVAGPL